MTSPLRSRSQDIGSRRRLRRSLEHQSIVYGYWVSLPREPGVRPLRFAAHATAGRLAVKLHAAGRRACWLRGGPAIDGAVGNRNGPRSPRDLLRPAFQVGSDAAIGIGITAGPHGCIWLDALGAAACALALSCAERRTNRDAFGCAPVAGIRPCRGPGHGARASGSESCAEVREKRRGPAHRRPSFVISRSERFLQMLEDAPILGEGPLPRFHREIALRSLRQRHAGLRLQPARAIGVGDALPSGFRVMLQGSSARFDQS